MKISRRLLLGSALTLLSAHSALAWLRHGAPSGAWPDDLKNPIFVDGDLLYKGVVIREVAELSIRPPVFNS